MSEKAKKLCFDKILSRDLVRPHRGLFQGPGRPARAISPRGKQWANGQTLTIAFKGGNSTQQAMVREVAPEWTEYANLKFEFTTKPNATVRVSFDADDGAWSYVGTDNLEIPVHAATLNLGWQDKAVILHEFGHMVGLAHEHQNPKGGIVWNEAAVIADLMGPPNRWDEATIRHNVLDKYSMDQILGTDFDSESIMLYAFPASWVKNGPGTDFNEELSKHDQTFVGSTQMYPGTVAKIPELPVNASLPSAISSPGEEDSYQFTAAKAGDYVIETGGATDVTLRLYGPNSTTKLIAQNDDGGMGRNARIEAALQPGKYHVRVKHFHATGTGAYRLWVTA